MTMHGKPIKKVIPDAKGRVTLGKLADGISSFFVYYDNQGRIILIPFVEIPAHEKWLYDNKDAMKQVKAGLKDAEDGRISSRGSFKQYLDDDESE